MSNFSKRSYRKTGIMKGNSDNSDFEDENVSDKGDQKGRDEHRFPKLVGGQLYGKKHFTKKSDAGPAHFKEELLSSDSSDSDSSRDDRPSFNQPEDESKFRSRSMYQGLSCEQELNEYSSDADGECDKVSNALPEIGDSGKLEKVFPDSSDEDNKPQSVKPKGSIPHDDKPQFCSNPTSSKDNSLNDLSRKRKSLNIPSDNNDPSRKRKSLNTPSDNTTTATKRPKIENIVQHMMGVMGYEPGRGLGKNKQGRLEPVQEYTQRGRRGFGLPVPKLQATDFEWNPDEEEVKVVEDIKWISTPDMYPPSLKEMQSWLELGPKKETIDDETTFCNPSILSHILKSKTLFDDLDNLEMRRARTRSNPFETIRGAFFLNRAAVKMANMDRACDFMFTNPKDLKDGLLYFADVCAGPGGFSEYVLWRKKWKAKGFGFTLKNENDFKLSDFYAGPCETFHPYYGPKDDGDVFDPSNQEAFCDIIMKHTNGKGVHFMMADGGFSVEGRENIQEILSKQLYLCQCLVALMIVRTKGNFVTKLFDLFTPFSAGLVYIMYRCFDRVCIFKPNTSRPANSERYLICQGKRPQLDDVIKHLKYINRLLIKNEDNNDVRQLVTLDELEKEKQFVQYLIKSNEDLGKKQIIGLNKIAAFCKNPNLIEPRQADMRKECLKYWEVPDDSRRIPKTMPPIEKVRGFMINSSFSLTKEPTKLTKDIISNTILNQPLDWFYMPSGAGPYDEVATFYLGMGRSKVFRYVKGSWMPLNDDVRMDLPPDTLVYAQMVHEFKKEYRQQHKILALHIYDAFMLGGDDISSSYIEERHKLITKFCDALRKPVDKAYIPVRAKDMYLLDHTIYEKLRVRQRIMKNNLRAQTYELLRTPLDDDNDDLNMSYLALNGILFLRSIVPPWNRYYSKTNNPPYVSNCKTSESKLEIDKPLDAIAKFAYSFENSVVWHWPSDETISMETFVQLIRQKLRKP